MLKLMKSCAGLGGFIILIIGLAMVGVTIKAYIDSYLSFNNYVFLGILIGADLVIILGAVLGIIGIKRQNGALIFIFQIFVMVFFCVFLGIGIASELLPRKVFNGNCENSTYQYVQLAGEAYSASSSLCFPGESDLSCACDLTDNSIEKQGYNDTQKEYLRSLNRTSGGALQFQECPQAKQWPYNENKYQIVFNTLIAVEESLFCSGWCSHENVLYYKFSNVNRGIPKYACYDAMKDNLNKYGRIIGICAFTAAFFMLLVCICGLCVCLSPQRRKQPFASRFVFRQNGYYHAVD